MREQRDQLPIGPALRGRQRHPPPAGQQQQPGADRPVEPRQPRNRAARGAGAQRSTQSPRADVGHSAPICAPGSARHAEAWQCPAHGLAAASTRALCRGRPGCRGAARSAWPRRRRITCNGPAPRSGDELALFNGRDGEWRARIAGFGATQPVARSTSRPRAADARSPTSGSSSRRSSARGSTSGREGDRARRQRALAGVDRHTMVDAGQCRAPARQCDRGRRAERAADRARDPRARRRWSELLEAWPPARRLIFATKAARRRRSARRLQGMTRAGALRGADRARRRLRRSELDALRQTPLCYARSVWGRACCAPTPPRSRRLRVWQALVGRLDRQAVAARDFMPAPRSRDRDSRSHSCPLLRSPAARRSPTSASSSTILAAGCKPRADWRIGTEHEKFVFDLQDLQAARL